MKKTITFAVVIILLGLLIALGPQFLFKVCGPAMASSLDIDIDDCCIEPEVSSCCAPAASSLPICHWSAQAEIGIGLLIVALGACMMVFTDPQTHLGLAIGTFFASIIALAVPNFLIGGCDSLAMRCRRIAFPALTAESIVLLIFSAVLITIIVMQKPQPIKQEIEKEKNF
jgi:hypothetical protein